MSPTGNIPDGTPPAFTEDRAEERRRMVEEQLARPGDSRPRIRDPRVLRAMERVPRHLFVPPAMRDLAYADHPLPVGESQTISQPYIVALMTELLAVGPSDKTLEVGTGSGYQTAVLACLTRRLYTIEIRASLAERAHRRFAELGLDHLRCRLGDGALGWPEEAPFDAVIITCALPSLPHALLDQVRPGGRIVAPLEGETGAQWLAVVTPTGRGRARFRPVIPVRFVRMARVADPEALASYGTGPGPPPPSTG